MKTSDFGSDRSQPAIKLACLRSICCCGTVSAATVEKLKAEEVVQKHL